MNDAYFYQASLHTPSKKRGLWPHDNCFRKIYILRERQGGSMITLRSLRGLFIFSFLGGTLKLSNDL